MRSQAIAAAIGASATLTACIGIALAPPGNAAPGHSCSVHGNYAIAGSVNNRGERGGISRGGDINCSNAYTRYSTYPTVSQPNPREAQPNVNPTAAQPNVQGPQGIGPYGCYSRSAQQNGSTDLQFGCVRGYELNGFNGNNGNNG